MKYGIREICDVVLKAKSNQKIGNKIFYKDEPVLYFDTLKTSTMEGAATTVYAQGGRGNSRLVAWEGERTVTFTMEDALISPTGFAILSGAGLIEASKSNKIKVHKTEIAEINELSNGAYGLKTSNTPYGREKSIISTLNKDKGELIQDNRLNFEGTCENIKVSEDTADENNTLYYLNLLKTDIILGAIYSFKFSGNVVIKGTLFGNPPVVNIDDKEFYQIKISQSDYNKLNTINLETNEPVYAGGCSYVGTYQRTSSAFYMSYTDFIYLKNGTYNCTLTSSKSDADGRISYESLWIFNKTSDSKNKYTVEYQDISGYNASKDSVITIGEYGACIYIAKASNDKSNGIESIVIKEWNIDTQTAGKTIINSSNNYFAPIDIYAMKLNNGQIISEPYIPLMYDSDNNLILSNFDDLNEIKVGDQFLVDYYIEVDSGVQQIEITPDKFGGNYYLEASTLFRTQDGVDEPANFIIPNCKIQSNFNFTMASSGDPSTFTFTMDAFPDYLRFDKSKKVLAAIQLIKDNKLDSSTTRDKTKSERKLK